MNVISSISTFTSRIASTPPSAVPGIVIGGYTKYLWDYEPNSWVAKIASSYRVLAFFIALPVVVLGLLDIVSYGIARTLGIVDDVKASTSDQAIGPSPGSVPLIYINGESSPASESQPDSDRELGVEHVRAQRKAASDLLAASQPTAFYASDSDGLRLAGGDVFSPAVSEPSSPTISRKNTFFEEVKDEDDHQKLGEGLRQRPTRVDEKGN